MRRVTLGMWGCYQHWHKIPYQLRRELSRAWLAKLKFPNDLAKANEHTEQLRVIQRWVENHVSTQQRRAI